MKFQYVRLRGHLFMFYNEAFDFWDESAAEGTIYTRDDRNRNSSRLKDGFWIEART